MKPVFRRPAQPEEQGSKEGITEKLKGIIASLDEATELMQRAIVGQNVSEIWTVLAEQERVAAEFQQYACLWGHLISGGRGNPEVERNIREINASYEAVKRKNKCNMALIKSFMATLNRALGRTGTQNASRVNVYGRHGKMQYRQSSIVLSQEG